MPFAIGWMKSSLELWTCWLTKKTRCKGDIGSQDLLWYTQLLLSWLFFLLTHHSWPSNVPALQRRRLRRQVHRWAPPLAQARKNGNDHRLRSDLVQVGWLGLWLWTRGLRVLIPPFSLSEPSKYEWLQATMQGITLLSVESHLCEGQFWEDSRDHLSPTPTHDRISRCGRYWLVGVQTEGSSSQQSLYFLKLS